MNEDQKKRVDRMLRTYDVTSNQCVKIVKEISYTPDPVSYTHLALVVSIPLGYFGGIGAASRLGILFKGGNYLDAITKINTVAVSYTHLTGTSGFIACHIA